MRLPRCLARHLAATLLALGAATTLAPSFAHAADATRHDLKPHFAIPMHHSTSPMLTDTAEEYVRALGRTDTKVLAIPPGEQVPF